MNCPEDSVKRLLKTYFENNEIYCEKEWTIEWQVTVRQWVTTCRIETPKSIIGESYHIRSYTRVLEISESNLYILAHIWMLQMLHIISYGINVKNFTFIVQITLKKLGFECFEKKLLKSIFLYTQFIYLWWLYWIVSKLLLVYDVDVDVVCRRRLKASLPASKIQY